MQLEWTPQLIEEWQTFYNNASRWLVYGQSGNITVDFLPKLPEYEDLEPPPCKKGIPTSTPIPTPTPSSAVRPTFFVLTTLISIFMASSFIFF